MKGIMGILPLLALLIAAGMPEVTPPSPRAPSAVTSVNKKRASLYAERQVFITSDREWKNVLGLVPVSMWHEAGALKKYPVLLYHEEDSGFDADSIIHFIEQYNPESIVLVGSTPEDLDNLIIAEGYAFDGTGWTRNITRISPDDYASYWELTDTYIVCEDSYRLGLLASVYASYINAPYLRRP